MIHKFPEISGKISMEKFPRKFPGNAANSHPNETRNGFLDFRVDSTVIRPCVYELREVFRNLGTININCFQGSDYPLGGKLC